MPYVWMDETARVDAVGAGGRAMSPAVPVDAGDSMTEGGRGAHADPKTPKIPNPELAEDGKVITTEDGTYVLGEGGGSGGGEGGSGILKVNIIEDETGKRLDKTWQEICDADLLVCVRDATFTEESASGRGITYYNITEVSHTTHPLAPAPYTIMVVGAGFMQEFICDSTNDYPELSGGGSGPEIVN